MKARRTSPPSKVRAALTGPASKGTAAPSPPSRRSKGTAAPPPPSRRSKGTPAAPEMPECLATLLRRLPDWPEIPAFVVMSNLGISRYILARLVRAGEVKTRILRGRCLIDRASLARCLASRLTGPGGDAARAWIAALDRLDARKE